MRGRLMKPNEILQDMQAKVSEMLKQSPAKDIERNVKSLLNQGFTRLDLVTREEFDVQAQVLARTREKLEALEKRVAALESLRNEAQD
ncbi:phosphoheptose isomerase [Pandoraea iniqua]|uniref:Ubiquinone biosynthesis accessory factor UbiK n=3 Tax=Burkholderiaceae TaxID=119060 RepID=A0A5E4SIE3_9BURK|nr:phosphoheptose isomerase [Pandoraea norimbergensis]VVD70949.1 phosphoheptose isomerase [Pandoraea iniqua]VVD74542.1 phosphoheptose isomerase [Pandoraea iniqua]